MRWGVRYLGEHCICVALRWFSVGQGGSSTATRMDFNDVALDLLSRLCSLSDALAK